MWIVCVRSHGSWKCYNKQYYTVLQESSSFTCISGFIISSKERKSALFRWCNPNMAVFHRRLEQGRPLMDFGLFYQQQLPVLHPNKCSWFFVCQKRTFLRLNILRTPWSNHPDTVFLLEPWGLLNDLTHNKLRKELACFLADHCCFVQRICCYDHQIFHTPRHRYVRQPTDLRRGKFSTVDLQSDIESCYQCRIRWTLALLRIL